MNKPNKPAPVLADESKPTKSNGPRGSLWSRSMPLKGLEQFCQRFGVGLRSGVDIMRLLEVERKMGSSSAREAAGRLSEGIRAGESLAEAMEAQQGFYPRMLVQMVSAGEAGGGLDRVFLHMSEYYKDLRDARGDFLQRISWPLIQLGLAILIVSGVIVLQEFLSPSTPGPNDLKYDASGLGLRGMSGLFYFWTFLALFFGAIGLVAFGIWKNWFGCHKVLVPLVRNIPVIGTVFTTLALSRMSMTLAMLLNAGVDAKRCIKEAFKSTGNFYYMSGMKTAEEEVGRGQSFAHALEVSNVIPRDFVQAIEVGELSGTETDSLERIAKEYQRRSKTALAQLAMATSVAIWAGIAIFLIFLIIRMFMQYVNLLNNAGKI